jgi:hypothetical protein
MPISGGGGDIASIMEALSGIELSGTGGNAYRYAVAAKVDLLPGDRRVIVPAVSEKVHREVSVKLVSGEFVNLGWGQLWIESYRLLKLDPLNSIFKDVSDGGLELNCWSEVAAEIEVIVRSYKPIDYLIGGVEPMTIVGVRLLIETDKDYGENISDIDIWQKLRELTGSDESLTGHKLFQITGFNPHEPLSFTVDASSATSFNGDKIDVQFLSNVELIKLLFKVGINAFLQVTVPELISGEGELGDCFTHAALIPGITGGTLTVTPDFGFNICRFVCTSSLSGMGDTCVIQSYVPNETNPQQGGTFVLSGF